MAKQLLFEQEAKRKILQGISRLAKTVKVTLGPTGRNVILQKSFGSPTVTKDGVASGEGCMNYDLDMPPYVQDMADWLNDDAKVHPCNFESAYKGFEIMMALCRSAAEGGQVSLPITKGGDELKMLEGKMRDAKVILSFPESEKEYSS